MLGQYLNISLSTHHEILTLYNCNPGNCLLFNSLKIDLCDFRKLADVFFAFSPEVVLHTAAISRPETCDAMPEEIVLKTNVMLTRELAILCSKIKAKIIYTSTDLVYDGDNGGMLKEDSKINPVSLYATTKYESEKEIEKIFENYLILRTALLYGIGIKHSVNNFHLAVNNFRNGKPVRLFNDQYRTPLSLIDAAGIISKLISPDITGLVMNFAGKERVSRLELGELLCDTGGFDKKLVEPISMNDVPNLHKVKDVSLDTSLLNSFGINQKDIKQSIGEILEYNAS